MVACLERNDGNAEFHQILDFLSSSTIHYALTVSPTIYAYYIEQFWTTAKSQIVNNVKQIHAIVDGKAVVISESLVRNDLLFDNEDGITCLTNDDIFENLTLMGSKSTGWNEFSTNLASAVKCLAKAHIEQILPSPCTYQRQQPKDPNTYRRTKRGRNTKVPQPGGSPKKFGDEAVYIGEDDRVVSAATTASSLEAEQESHEVSEEPSKRQKIEETSNSGAEQSAKKILRNFMEASTYMHDPSDMEALYHVVFTIGDLVHKLQVDELHRWRMTFNKKTSLQEIDQDNKGGGLLDLRPLQLTVLAGVNLLTTGIEVDTAIKED
ncbi:hypothetical protein Tco_0925384 [Tanacetum coccineum]|uniref:Xylulose kinase-1 n=1 Tax=Tanacetum coccineum TaxID=301880 RepID=A0ABQ5D6R5_9ASTR